MSVSYQNIDLFFGGKNNDLNTYILNQGDAIILDYNTNLSNQNSFIIDISFEYTFPNRSLLLQLIWATKGEP